MIVCLEKKIETIAESLVYINLRRERNVQMKLFIKCSEE